MGKREEKCMKTNTDLFEKVPVPKAVATMAVPTMISMLVVVIYNMADTFFIGQTQDPLQVAAVSLATPVFMIFMALGNLFGIGGSSAISRALGEKHKDRAWHISSFCCYGALGLGVIVAVCSVLGMEGILGLIGASENTIGFARKYLLIISIGAPTILFSTAFANILRGEGGQRVYGGKPAWNYCKYCAGSGYDPDVRLGSNRRSIGYDHWKYCSMPVLSAVFSQEKIHFVYQLEIF